MDIFSGRDKDDSFEVLYQIDKASLCLNTVSSKIKLYLKFLNGGKLEFLSEEEKLSQLGTIEEQDLLPCKYIFF